MVFASQLDKNSACYMYIYGNLTLTYNGKNEILTKLLHEHVIILISDI